MTFTPVPDAARKAAEAGLLDWHPEWDDMDQCETGFDVDHDHEHCAPVAWWPMRETVAAAAVRGLLDAGWTLTPPTEVPPC